MEKINILNVDPSPGYRGDLERLFEGAGDPKVHLAWNVSRPREALAIAIRESPDVILIHPRIHALVGVALTRQFVRCRPKSNILIYAKSANGFLIHQFIRMGARGYIIRPSFNNLMSAIKKIASNDVVLDDLTIEGLDKIQLFQDKVNTKKYFSLKPDEVDMLIKLLDSYGLDDPFSNENHSPIDIIRTELLFEKLGVQSLFDLMMDFAIAFEYSGFFYKREFISIT